MKLFTIHIKKKGERKECSNYTLHFFQIWSYRVTSPSVVFITLSSTTKNLERQMKTEFSSVLKNVHGSFTINLLLSETSFTVSLVVLMWSCLLITVSTQWLFTCSKLTIKTIRQDTPEAYSKPSQTSTMELRWIFCKNSFAKSSILDVWLDCEYTSAHQTSSSTKIELGISAFLIIYQIH